MQKAQGHAWLHRIIVVVVPLVDELDLVGPLQVFNWDQAQAAQRGAFDRLDAL